MQCQYTVHSVDPLMVPGMPLVPEIISHLATAPTRLSVCQLTQLLSKGFIHASPGLIAKDTANELHCVASLPFAQSKFLHGIANQSPLLSYLESFFSMISFSTSCSRLRFAYISFKRRFSSSNSFIRFTSLTLIPPYLAFHL